MSMNNMPSVPGLSRRSFINATALAAAGTALAGRSVLAAAAAPAASAPMTPNASAGSNYAKALVEAYGRPNSKFNGVQVLSLIHI